MRLSGPDQKQSGFLDFLPLTKNVRGKIWNLADHTPHLPPDSGRILNKKCSCLLFDKALNGLVKGVIQPEHLDEFCDDENSFDLIFHPCNA